ncbi:hypothetical protein C1646_701802, partial [Rhizophagus diaphanus]
MFLLIRTKKKVNDRYLIRFATTFSLGSHFLVFLLEKRTENLYIFSALYFCVSFFTTCTYFRRDVHDFKKKKKSF